MPGTFADNLPIWAKPYAPIGGSIDEKFSLKVRLTTLNETIPVQPVNNSFTVGFVANKPPIVTRESTVIFYNNPQDAMFKATANTVVINKGIGFFGVTAAAKNYKRDEVQYMRNFPTDSFPLGVVSLDKVGKSVYAQKLQYGKQTVIALPILQMITVASYLGGTQSLDELSALTLDTVNGRLWYPDIVADIGLLTIYQSCVLTFVTDVQWR
jgi:hypothetical protein